MSQRVLLTQTIESCLPRSVLDGLYGLVESGRICPEDINEIRLRVGRPVSLTCREKNISLPAVLSEEELEQCVTRFCRGSVYAHADTMRRGYIISDSGVRIGVCGTLMADGLALSRIGSINIRVPHAVRGVCDGALAFCTFGESIRSTLFYSPPGGGKTTLLRDLAARLGLERRVALVDTRGELYIEEMFHSTLCDVLVGYPRAEGIEIATRTLSPEVIICDELGDADEARQLLSCVSAGVPVIASAHASCIAELMARPNIRMLHENGVFWGYIGIRRERVNGKLTRSFICDYTAREDVPC